MTPPTRPRNCPRNSPRTSPRTSPRITVITPTLNQAPFIERTICSVLDQGYDNLEYFVLDGGSDDGTLEILGLYEDELAWWRSTPDAGPAAAINEAIARATGEIVMIIHGDDLLLPGALDAVAERMGQSDHPVWMVGRSQHIDEADRELGEHDAVCPEALGDFLAHDAGWLPLEASAFRRELFEQRGGLREEMRWGYGFELACRLLAAGERPAMPAMPGTPVVAVREGSGIVPVARSLRAGRESIKAAALHAGRLGMNERYGLWKSLDERRRIYAIAEAEAVRDTGRHALWSHLLRHPWWLADENYRHALLHGIPARSLPMGLAEAA